MNGLLLIAGLLVLQASPAAGPDSIRVYFGTYTSEGGSRGIYMSQFNPQTGTLTPAELAAEVGNPSFLAVSPQRGLLFAVSEMSGPAGKGGAVSSLAVDGKTGHLTLLSQAPSGGAGPCHLSVDHTGRFVLVANYGSGNVSCLPVGEDGRLGPATDSVQHSGSSVNAQRQSGPHAHWVDVDPANRFALVCDLGLDQIRVYQFDALRGTLRPNAPPFVAITPGAGPRHFAFHPNGRWGYVVNEMGSTVTALDYDAEHGRLEARGTVGTLPADSTLPSTTAEIQVHPSGRFLYASNRGHDSIAVFRIAPETGALEPAGQVPSGGKTPRCFAVEPGGRYLLAANQGSDNIVVFRIAPETGGLTSTGASIEVPKAVCVVFPQ